MTAAHARDAVVRKAEFEKAHPEVSFSVEPPLLIHYATWVDPQTGQEVSEKSLFLGHLMDRLEREIQFQK
jgi:hypothetical protein